LIFSIILVCFIYLGVRVNKIISPPLLTILSPEINLITEQTSLLAAGQTEAEANLTINGETVLSDKNGNFSQVINLKNGLNVITFVSRKKYSRSNIIIRQVLVKNSEPSEN